MSESPTASTATQALAELEQRRQLLQQLIGVTAVIESLKHSLAQMLTPHSPDQPAAIESMLASLDDEIHALPDDDINHRLESLDRRLRALYGQLMPVIEEIQAAESPSELTSLTTAVHDAGELRELVQAAMAVRILLSQRGLQVPEFRLPLDRARLEVQLQTVTDKEQACRQQVIGQVREMEQDLLRLLGNANLPEAMRTLMSQMLSGLQDNLRHLQAGLSISELPLPIEAASFVEQAVPVPPSPQPDAHPADPSADPAPCESPTLSGTDSDTPPVTSEPTLQPPSLMQAILLWISSPWNVSWQDIRSGRYQRDRQ